jgi:heat shock protein HslJ
MMRPFLALAVFALSACTTPADAPAPISLSGTAWQRFDDENANPHGATMEFGDHRASGYTGCNRWFAAVVQNGEILRFGDVGMTRMACQAEVQTATERNFLSVIERTRYGHYDQEVLVLLDAEQQVIAQLNRTSPLPTD